MTLQEEIKELNKIHDELEPTFEYTLSELEELKQQVRAEVIEEVKRLIDKRESEKCNKGSCDDCVMCCEIRVLDWLFEQLKENK